MVISNSGTHHFLGFYKRKSCFCYLLTDSGEHTFDSVNGVHA